jgi:antitoxin component of MazEF toxin-antitoxin module
MQARVQRHNDQWIVILPDAFVEAAGLKEGSLVDISFGSATTSPETGEHQVYSLDELLAGITPEPPHDAT